MYRQLHDLLDRPGSGYGPVLRGYLLGLDAALADLAQHHPDDPGVTDVDSLRRDIAALLGKSDPVLTPKPGYGPPPAKPVPAPKAGLPPDSPKRPPPGPPAAWDGSPSASMDGDPGLYAEFAADPLVAPYLGDTPLPDLAALLLATLRLPPEPAAAWRQRAQRGCGTPGQTDRWEDVPSFVHREVLVPPEVSAGRRGLRLRPETQLPADLSDALRLRPGDHGPACRLAVAAAQLLSVGARDGHLVDLLPTRDGLPPGRFDRSRDLAAYRSELLRRLHAYAVADDPEAQLMALLDVDEAVCSAVHQPPAAEGSWWAGLYSSVRDQVFKAGTTTNGAQLTQLSGRYVDIAGMTTSDAMMLGKPGTVLACIRLWASVAGRTYPGRVIIGAD